MAKNIFLELELFLDPPIDEVGAMKEHLEKKRIPSWQNNQVSIPGYEILIDRAKKYIATGLPRLEDEGKEARKEKYDELERQAKIIIDLGATEKNVKNLVNDFKKFFREDTIKKLVSSESSSSNQSDVGFVIPDCPASLKCKKPISFGDMLKISVDLDAATDGKSDSLYKLLGVREKDKTADILTEATKKAKEINDITKKDIKANALNRLARKFVLIFKSDTERNKYDVAIKRFCFDGYADKTLKLYAEAWATKNKIKWKQYHACMDEVKILGYTEEEAAWLVYEYCCITKKCPLPKKPKEGAGWGQHEGLRSQLFSLFRDSIEHHQSNPKIKNKLFSVIEQFNAIDDPDDVESTVRQIIEVDLRKFWDSCKNEGSVSIPLFKPAQLANFSRLKDYLRDFTH